MATNLPLGSLAAAQSLLSLSEAAVAVLADVAEDGETPEETVARLQTTYGTIPVAIGVRPEPLMRLLRSLLACRAALAVAPQDMAPFVAQAVNRTPTYGPARRQPGVRDAVAP